MLIKQCNKHKKYLSYSWVFFLKNVLFTAIILAKIS